jgi:hypothetical protein
MDTFVVDNTFLHFDYGVPTSQKIHTPTQIYMSHGHRRHLTQSSEKRLHNHSQFLDHLSMYIQAEI